MVFVKKKPRKKVTRVSPELKEEVLRLALLKKERESLDRKIKRLSDSVITQMDELNVTSLTGDHPDFPDQIVKVALVKATRVVIDEEQVRKEVGGTIFSRISVRSIDTAKLEDQLAKEPAGGKLHKAVERATEIVDNKPYVRTTLIVQKKPKEALESNGDPIAQDDG